MAYVTREIEADTTISGERQRIRGGAGIVRVFDTIGSNPQIEDDAAPTSVDVCLGESVQYCVIQDVHSVFRGKNIVGGTSYGNFCDKIGWHSTNLLDPRRNHGHPGYEQSNGAVLRYSEANILVAGVAGTAGKYYATDFDVVRGFRDKQNVYWGGRRIIGCKKFGAHDYGDDGSYFLDARLQLGYGGAGTAKNGRGSITNCVLTDGAQFTAWNEFVFTGNTVLCDARVTDPEDPINSYAMYFTKLPDAFECNHNHYRVRNPICFAVEAGIMDGTVKRTRLTFAQWQRLTGNDLNSTCTVVKDIPNAADPTKPTVVPLLPAKQWAIPIRGGQERLANLVLFDDAQSGEVEVDFAALGMPLHYGKPYRLRQVRDFDNDVREFVYEDKPIRVNMTYTVEPLRNWTLPTKPPGVPEATKRAAVFFLETSDVLEREVIRLTSDLAAAQARVRQVDAFVAEWNGAA